MISVSNPNIVPGGNLDPSKPLWLCQSEEDAAIVGDNAIAYRGPLKEILKESRGVLASFPSVLVVRPDAANWTELDLLRAALQDTPISTIRPDALAGCQSVSELVSIAGKDVLKSVSVGAIQADYYGLVDMGDVPYEDYGPPLALYPISELNDYMGGIREGELTIVTGCNHHGKSTFLQQTVLDVLDNGLNVCIYSGEFKKERLLRLMAQQAAGGQNCDRKFIKGTNRDYYLVRPQYVPAISKWFKKRLYAYDTSIADANNLDSILRVLERAVTAENCKVILWDNIMSTKILNGTESDYYRRQSEVVGIAIEFAHRFGVHIFLVAHPKKFDGEMKITDISGSGDISNRADNVLSIVRLEDEEKAINGGYDGIVRVFKNREFPDSNKNIGMFFDPSSRRFSADPRFADLTPYGWTKFLPGSEEYVQTAF